jgi:hypothetical protein
VETDGQRGSLAAYLDAIRRAQELDRRPVRQHATVDFDSRQIVDAVLHALEAVRVLIPGMARRRTLVGTVVY